MEFLQISVSLIAIIISIIALIQSKRSKRSTVINEMNQQANLINDATTKYGVKSPYAVLRGISNNKEDIIEFEALGSAFFHHINLLYLVYSNKNLMGKRVFNGYVKWIQTVFRPWIESDDDLIWTWKKVKETKDLFGNDFIEWLDNELNIYRDKSN